MIGSGGDMEPCIPPADQGGTTLARRHTTTEFSTATGAPAIGFI